ncbi:MAG: selenoneine synthase SenA [Gammaproteobacteria bacterium]|nr:selenoneine synthase SenA [Gammaproteobacteria bacterium]
MKSPAITHNLIQQMEDAQTRTLALIEGLNDQQMMGPLLPTVNPLLWEIGHVAYFYEYWVLRQHLGRAAIRADVDNLYDSITIAHDDRWDLPLPELAQTLEYINCVFGQVKKMLSSGKDEQRDYLAQYAVYHHDMHNEAFTYTRQTLKYPTPERPASIQHMQQAEDLSGDAEIPGGTFMLGAHQHDGFVFDNEKWAHPVEIDAFRMARVAVSNQDFLGFVEAGGYRNRDYWSDEGWLWREHSNLNHPVYWRNGPIGWQVRQFDQWIPLPLKAALIHVSWYEALAYCNWAERRLPSEAEWEVAASAQPTTDGLKLSQTKRYFPWGDSPPEPGQANLDGYTMGTIDVSACASGDSAFGCRQMIGNVWEWTHDTFGPYPGFKPDMYQDYSQPLFGNTKVLRGGAWTTRSRMIRNTWRTYYGPDRNDVFAGFRTCAL